MPIKIINMKDIYIYKTIYIYLYYTGLVKYNTIMMYIKNIIYFNII